MEQPVTRKPEIHHHSALVERHWVTVALPVKATEARRASARVTARERALPLLAAAGLPVEALEDWNRPGESGVSWTVKVGEAHWQATERQPYWVWTGRWRHWRAVLEAVALRDRSARMSALVDGHATGALSLMPD